MISPPAYEIGSVIHLGGCTVHSLAVSSAKQAFPQDEWIAVLRDSLCELVSAGHLTWEVWPQSYGDGPCLPAPRNDDAEAFRRYWNQFYSAKMVEADFWMPDHNGIRDVEEPTIEVSGAESLGKALGIYEAAHAEPSTGAKVPPAGQRT